MFSFSILILMPTFLLLVAIFLAPIVFAGETATTPSALWASFQNGSETFLQKYDGKQITVTAIVAETYISKYLTPVVGLVDKMGEEVKVICVLPRTDTPKLSSFKQNAKVKMTGNFYSAREDKIVIKQCQAN